MAHWAKKYAGPGFLLCALTATALPKTGEKWPPGPAGCTAYPTLPATLDFSLSSNWPAKFTPSKYMATWLCMKALLHSYQLKFIMPGGAKRLSIPS